ncbi:MULTISPECIES: CBS domain-containing protein [Halomicrobium]|uniref:CBS domain-containing protein n=2 Tax=Halomicrobium mukohataei TaxID=57705 RepID=A0A4D6KDU9_9EURY|nr:MULTISPECIES: CBS domain-containing protein [Halomicrobium]ACV48744.1 putative signal transduction protein with CBS domains [Halomicrobium mukohataei DSM 12286]QCD64173.1 CBS domain-containing protein [Halomicrobium mukohataei]QFR18979.1 CBS domain-containing protein [Halomicrobium sp. ZPS1]
MLVEELMSTAVVTVDLDATLAEAVQRQLDAGVGSVVVLDDGAPCGIVTEHDALAATLRTGRPLDDIPVAKLAHGSVVTTTPETAVRSVARQMSDEGVKKVPVLDDLDLVGILTLTDIVWHLSDIEGERSEIEATRERWESAARF